MNSCILMAEIVEEPQLRYTTDNLAITEMLVQFPGLRAEDPPATLKVVGWGNLAQEIEQKYHKGDRLIIEGRLSMNTVQLEGYKEKRAELIVQRIHPLGAGVSLGVAATATDEMSSHTTTSSPQQPRPEPVEKKPAAVGATTESEPAKTTTQPKSAPPVTYTPVNTDVDDIPF